jgi:hypothetical protein
VTVSPERGQFYIFTVLLACTCFVPVRKHRNQAIFHFHEDGVF